jgi:hypothetical protein
LALLGAVALLGPQARVRGKCPGSTWLSSTKAGECLQVPIEGLEARLIPESA